MSARRLSSLLAVLALLAAGCAGGDDDEAAQTPSSPSSTAQTETAPPPDGGTPAGAPGKVLLTFVRAAGKADAATMWGLLTEPTQASIGPTLDDFRADAAGQLRAGLGALAPTAKVILSRKLSEDWSVAAIAGDTVEDGETEHFAYAAALLPEGGKPKLELGGVVITGHKPDPSSEIEDATPTISANVGAGGDLVDVRVWLDGEPFPAKRGENDTPFTATLTGTPAQPLAPGLHHVVVFARTAETASASAWSFTVE